MSHLLIFIVYQKLDEIDPDSVQLQKHDGPEQKKTQQK